MRRGVKEKDAESVEDNKEGSRRRRRRRRRREGKREHFS